MINIHSICRLINDSEANFENE